MRRPTLRPDYAKQLNNIGNREVYEMTLQSIELWHRTARPAPVFDDFNVQLGCHFEEIVEMMQCIDPDDFETFHEATRAMYVISKLLKTGQMKVEINHRTNFLDSIADQIVTGVGVAYTARMDSVTACERVNLSNWSKFDWSGQPIRDEHGKIVKGPNYIPPTLDDLC